MRLIARSSMLAVIITVTALVARPSGAQESQTPPEAVSAGEGGAFFDQVDPRTGAMTYVYRFDLPAARGLSGPALGLQYNSSTRDREAGYGWGLDVPSIELRPLAGLARFDVAGAPLPNGHERYAFQGQSLVKICDVGAGCPAEPSTQGHPVWANGWTYYRLRVEGLFARFYRSANRSTWRVQFKGGEIVEFGTPVGETHGMPSAVEYANGGIVRWHPVARRDLQHPKNVVLYRWQPYGTRGILYLTDIYDTPSLATPTSISAFAHHTQLNWDGLDYAAGNYQSAERAAPDFRLARVAVASKSWTASGAREVYRVYALDYYAQRRSGAYDPIAQGPLWHHSFLRQIRLSGHCGQTEKRDGTIGESQCARLPAMQFDYEPGVLGGFIANVSQIQAGPPGAVEAYGVLPFPESAAIVDFDRDGLPDVIQSWQGPQCSIADPRRRVAVRQSGASGGPELYCIQGVNDNGDTYGPYDKSLRSARPILGYQNRGKAASFTGSFRYQCMDAGGMNDSNSILQINAGSAATQRDHITQFFNAGSNTVLGAFGMGLGVWGRDEYLPFYARSLTLPAFGAGLEPANYALGGCFLDGQFDSNAFFPRWRWESRKIDSWTEQTIRAEPIGKTVEWFVDVDGDGYADVLRPEATLATSDFQHARVSFTRKYGTGEPTFTLDNSGQPRLGPALMPFVEFSGPGPTSLAPLPWGTWDPAPNGRKTQVFYADVNGDGLPDLVTSNFNEGGGILRVRPGDGTGRFSCRPGDSWTCIQDTEDPSTWFYEVTIASATKPWSTIHNGYTVLTFFALHDVTGDGLADIVRYNATADGTAPGGLEVWVNVDGHTFACVGIGGSCHVGTTFDSVNNAINKYGRLAFADMNADGVDDVVVLAKQGIFYGSFFLPTSETAPARGTRPGQLVRIHNGYGATTEIQYGSIQELDLEASKTAQPWEHHSPIVEAVVTRVRTHDDGAPGGGVFPAPYPFLRKVHYMYADPAYDGWQRKLAGFRRVATQVGDETAVTETTYWFGPCEGAAPPSQDASGNSSTNYCSMSSDDEFAAHPTFGSWVGRPVRIDRYIPANAGPTGPAQLLWSWYFGGPAQFLWSRYLEYEAPITLFSPAGDRHVTFTYAKRTETHVYRPELAVAPGAGFVPLAGGDRVTHPPVQSGSKIVEQRILIDTNGTVVEQREAGDAAEGDLPRVVQMSDSAFVAGAIPQVTCDRDWKCLPAYVTIAEDYFGLLRPMRRTRLTYETGTRDLALVEGLLTANHILSRSHETGASFSTAPPGQAIAGWKVVGQYEYTPEGFVAVAKGPGTSATPSRACTRFVPDEAYGQFPKVIQEFKGGCDSVSRLETRLVFDRGFGTPVSTTAPDLGITRTVLDPFGRPQDIFESRPDQPSPGITKSAHLSYGDLAPISYIDVQRFTVAGGAVPIRSVQLLNGLRETVVRYDQGDGAAWIAAAWMERDAAGRPLFSHRDFTAPAMTDPAAAAITATSVSPFGSGDLTFTYDGFGRQQAAFENNLQVLQRTFSPLAVQLRDAEQLTGGGHIGAFTNVEFTTRGQVRRTSTHTSVGVELTTSTLYDVLGNPLTVSRVSPKGETYQRSQSWDSLGRLVETYEPNTVGRTTVSGWRYSWDDTNRLVGTSDGRGCGKDLYYDALGRLVGEDYSPCLASQDAYSAADPAKGTGFEVLNTYDTYEAGQVAPDAAFADDPVFANGHLVSLRDRGAITRQNYDVRGRVRRVSRRVAKPASQQAAGGDRYAPHWYRSRRDFDIADRLTFQSTGADQGPFVANSWGLSAETYHYSGRGLLDAIHTAHGSIAESITYDADGQLNAVAYSDLAKTKAALTYDVRRQLKTYGVTRAAPSLWSAPPTAAYSQPDSRTTQTNLASFDFVERDRVGNPTVIDDNSPASQWPASASPVRQRRISYDDEYRIISADYGYGTPSGPGVGSSPYLHESAVGDRRPVPPQSHSTRVARQTFAYDFLGNVAASGDDQNATYDRSLGPITNGDGSGASGWGPNQLTAARGVNARYDGAGNLVELKVQRPGGCIASVPLATSYCGQWFIYDWDEVGQLARARRWDFVSSLPATLPATPPLWDLTYAYSGGQRVLKTAKTATGVEHHTLEVFDTLRIEGDTFDTVAGDYERPAARVHVYLAGGIGHAFYDPARLPTPSITPAVRLFLNVGDHLGSTTVTIDHRTSEVVERSTFHPYGAIESDYRPERWFSARELYKFTGKEEDIEVGATYFGARYYQPYLGRFLSADPLAIHGLGGDLNPYAYVRGRVMSDVDPLGLQDQATNGSFTQPDSGTEVTWTYQWSFDTPSGFSSESVTTASDFASAAMNAGATHVPLGSGDYFTPNDVANAGLNMLKSALIGAADPLGYRHLAKIAGLDIEGAVMTAASDDPKNKSEIVAAVVAVVVSGAVGAAAGAAESRVAAVGGEALSEAVGGRQTAKVVNDVLRGRAPLNALTPAQRSAAARFYYDFAAGRVSGTKAEALRLFNIERARFLEGLTDTPPGSSVEFEKRMGIR